MQQSVKHEKIAHIPSRMTTVNLAKKNVKNTNKEAGKLSYNKMLMQYTKVYNFAIYCLLLTNMGQP